MHLPVHGWNRIAARRVVARRLRVIFKPSVTGHGEGRHGGRPRRRQPASPRAVSRQFQDPVPSGPGPGPGAEADGSRGAPGHRRRTREPRLRGHRQGPAPRPSHHLLRRGPGVPSAGPYRSLNRLRGPICGALLLFWPSAACLAAACSSCPAVSGAGPARRFARAGRGSIRCGPAARARRPGSPA